MDAMIDLETLSITSNAVILSVGACAFDLDKKEIYSTFEVTLDIDQQLKNRDINGSTILWWMDQSDEARSKITKTQKTNIILFLKNFSLWIKKNKIKYVWGNGSHFDISILQNLYEQYNVEVPWKYNKVQDLRTFKRFVANGKTIKRVGTAHSALDDAVSQAKYVLENI